MEGGKILLIDDDEALLKTLRINLERKGYSVDTCNDGKTAISTFEENKFNIELVIVDLVMRGINGIGVLQRIKELCSDTKVMIITAYGRLDTAIQALRYDADDYLLKPFTFEEFEFRISKCLAAAKIERKMQSYETILPICCVCKKIRDDTGHETWQKLETYLEQKEGIRTTHTYCPDCRDEYYTEMAVYKDHKTHDDHLLVS